MARPAKPWFREQTGWWMVKVNGLQTKLVQGPKDVGSSRVDLQACKLEYSIVSPK